MEDHTHPFGRKKHPLARISEVNCTGCGWCAMLCVTACIQLREDGFYEVDAEHCIGCRSCFVNCFYDAVSLYRLQEEDR